MRLLPTLACLILAGAAALAPAAPAPDLPPLPKLTSLRGQPASAIEELKGKNGGILHGWREQLTPEQRIAWFAAMGTADPKMERRFGSAKLPASTSGYDWRTVGRYAGLSESELVQLDRDKLLLEDISLQQSFEAYTKPAHPVFITSDSALNAFHVLFEDSFRELELRRAFTLRTHLENVVKKARELLASDRNAFPRIELQPGWRHAQLVVGPALRLLGTPVDFFDADARDEIESQLQKIRAATAVELPTWLAPASRTLLALDYRRCKPVGFYTDTESLQNYFRAVRWLQSVPFRADRDDELTAIGLLGYATNQDFEHGTDQFFKNYAALVSRPDNPALPETAYDFQNLLIQRRGASSWTNLLASIRHWLLRSVVAHDDWMKLNESLRLPPEIADQLSEIQFRVLSAARLPDSLALAKLADSGRLPSGLAVAALLGSDFARRQLNDVPPAKLDEALAVAREDWHPTKDDDRRGPPSFYDRYLDTLAALHLPAEPDAPAFMRSEPWAAKSCLTTLASWAQMRHAFTLQAKQSAMYMGLVNVPPGFVEPNPEFFRRLADLVEFGASSLDRADAFLPSAEAEAESLRISADHLEALGLHLPAASPKMLQDLTPEQRSSYRTAVAAHEDDWPNLHKVPIAPGSQASEFQKFHQERIAELRQRADDLASGKKLPALRRSVSEERWGTLKSVTRRLEALAHKQLRRQPWTTDEEIFIRNYGEQLAFVHGYFGNSWLTPRDDAPRWASVARDPNTDTQLAVGIGRARLIHVLYPYGDGEVLCTGAVMSYYEYPEPGTPLTDVEWRTKLDSPAAPPLPEWLKPYLAR